MIKIETIKSKYIKPYVYNNYLSRMSSAADKIIIGTTATSVVLGATGAALTGAGFTASGIVAGSIAAGIQASIGNVVAGSAFAGLQALGATGAIAVLGPISVVGLGVGTAYLSFKLLM